MPAARRAADRDPSASTPQLLVTADGSRTLLSRAYGESYHSRHGALSEARHVFLEASGVAARLAAKQPTAVLEVGFGTGLNALVTLDAAARTGAPLRYVALERDLLPAGTLATLGYGALLEEPALEGALLAWLGGLETAPAAAAALELGAAQLQILPGDARDARLPSGVHAVYHDAFSPSVNPELWDDAFLTRLFAALAPGGALVSFTVQGALRRRLAAIGFAVSKVPGPPGGKRETLLARRPAADGVAP